MSPDGESLYYTLTVHNMTGMIGAHIHAGTANQDGAPVLIGLFNKMSGLLTGKLNRILAKEAVTSSDVKDNMTSKIVIPHVGTTIELVPVVPDQITLNSSSTYVNVHTQMHQNGEIRVRYTA